MNKNLDSALTEVQSLFFIFTAVLSNIIGGIVVGWASLNQMMGISQGLPLMAGLLLLLCSIVMLTLYGSIFEQEDALRRKHL